MTLTPADEHMSALLAIEGMDLTTVDFVLRTVSVYGGCVDELLDQRLALSG